MTSLPETVRRRTVIVNADDFGASPQINQAIMQAFKRGLISSATIMANMPAFEEACQLVREHHLQRTIGVHLTLTEGKPLTTDIAECQSFCNTRGFWRPRRRIFRLNRTETLALEAEITAQVRACEAQEITPTHLDSHHNIHSEIGIAPVVIRVAKRLGIRSIRLARNCGPGRPGASATRRMLATVMRYAKNTRLRLHGLAKTDYYGDARDTAGILHTTDADVEVMVHPRLNGCGSVVDLDGEDLEAIITALRIPTFQLSSYYRE